MMRYFLLALMLGSICGNCFGQKSLLFSKNWRREAIYKTGDVLSFQVKADSRKITDQIIGFEDSLILFKNYKVNPKEITHIYVDKKTSTWYFLKYKWDKLLLFTGVGYLIVDSFNEKGLSEETLIISGSLIGAGLLARWLISKKIKIKGRRKLVIMK